jgi:hypothetical protein
VDIPTTVGATTAFAGFTAATGGYTSNQNILSWTMTSGTSGGGGTVATPTFNPAGGTYLGTQMVSLSDTTSGATIFYTLDGSPPATSAGGSTQQYSGPLTVTSTETIKTLATASGMTTSGTATATYTIESQVATPTFSPVAGGYSSAQPVTISTTSPAPTTIYYTTDGSTPTTSSTVYSGPITVSSSETLKALATKSGYFNSNVGTAAYTIGSTGGGGGISFGSGFSTGSMVLNGNATISGTSTNLSLTTTSPTFQASSAWFPTPVNIQNFTTDFSFQTSAGSPTADGLTFTLQNQGTTALGGAGGNLGYGLTTTPSVAVKFDLYSNNGEGVDSTGLYLNGKSPTIPAVDMTGSGIDLHSGDIFKVHMSYDGANLTMTITDATKATSPFSVTWTVDIVGTVGANTAFAGFTGATGGYTSNQNILSWTMTSGTSSGGGTVATPTFNPAGGTYPGTQTVTISDTTAGSTIFYTLDGSQPGTSAGSPTSATKQYSGPLTVSSTQTIKALATASGMTPSATATATYTIASTGGGGVAFSSGFPANSMDLNGSAALSGTALSLTTTAPTGQAGSAWYPTQLNVQKFTTDFTFQLSAGSPSADGFTFAIQGNTTTALGGTGGKLGYGNILKSVGVKFDLYNNAGEGNDSTWLYLNGPDPTMPAVDMSSSGVDLHSGHVFSVHIVYDGTNLTMTITDTTNTALKFTQTWAVDIPGTVGATAYVGFTGGTGGYTANQSVLTWTYTVN